MHRASRLRRPLNVHLQQLQPESYIVCFSDRAHQLAQLRRFAVAEAHVDHVLLNIEDELRCRVQEHPAKQRVGLRIIARRRFICRFDADIVGPCRIAAVRSSRRPAERHHKACRQRDAQKYFRQGSGTSLIFISENHLSSNNLTLD